MNWERTEFILYIASIICIGAGGSVLVFMKDSRMECRSTAAGILRGTLRRLLENRASAEKILEQLQTKIRTAKSRVYDMEIYDSSLLLKNMALVESGNIFSADYIYERLMEHADRLKPVYAQMLNLYRSGRDEAAFRHFSESCGSRSARNFAMILSRVDQIHPEALIEQMEVFQEIMGQQRMTAEMKRVQRNSVIITVMATAAVFIMVVDFAAVTVFMHTLAILERSF